MADRTPSTWSTSSSRMAVGSVATAGGTGVDATSVVGDAGDGAGIDGLGAVHAADSEADGDDGSGDVPLVIHDLLMSACALTFSIRRTIGIPERVLRDF